MAIVASPQELPDDAAQEAASTLEQTWRRPAGIVGWITAVNHRAIGKRYIATGLLFFALAGIAALLMRVQLMFPESRFLNHDLYNQLFTMHGTTMMFLFAVPIMEGVGIYLVPLMIGTRDMAFPRLNAFGYYIFLLAGVLLWMSLFFGSAPDGGWFAYVPLTGPEYSPGAGIDFYVTLITFLEVAALVAAVELIITVFKLRAPGMSLNRIPLFVWAILVMAFMIVFAMPPLMVGSVELMLDRTIATDFFNPDAGGQPLLWQHLFWFFGHPEVYIILVPALGIVSALVSTFSRRPIIGYIPLVLSFVAIGFLSFGLWVHHMFAAGLPSLSLSFFTAASMMIAIPSGVQIFATLATMAAGRVTFNTPMLYVVGFVVIFVLGGITGVMVAMVPFDWQVHDTYFVVAHFHYVLIGGAVMPLFGGIHYWFPKVTGRLLDERLGRWQFWLLFTGFNVTFFPMHITGFFGMPRRVYTYLDGLGWNELNFISTIGAFIVAVALLLFVVNLVKSWRNGEEAGPNPWNAGTLEWATTSPPQPYNFYEIAVVRSREPLWDAPETQERREQEAQELREEGLLALSNDRRETLGTTAMDARPQQRVVLPGPTWLPLWTALAAGFTFVATMIDLALVPVGAFLVFILIVAWHWPDAQQRDMGYAKAGPPGSLPTSTVASQYGAQPPFYHGVLFLLLIEAVVFASLISSYFYLRSGAAEWPLGGISEPELLLPTINTVVLLVSSIPIHFADSGIRKGNQFRLRAGLIAGFILGLIFLALKYVEYSNLDYTWATNAYGSIKWTIVGFHSAHVIALLLKTVVVGALAFQGYFNEERNAGVQANGIYWHFVVAVWIPLYATLYLAPYLF
ncbi:MAG TPA: cytochrome c oxidase subunit I [Candidatus Sulfomarinibacteraceae bacterium]|nr:cytochrome c oxidase subunit I [Candidatus Sulfomarinibacteraceae bacterium]